VFCVGGVSTLGYSGAGGLRQTPSAVLSRHRCDPDVFFYRQSRQPREHPGEMDARGASLLPERANHPRRQQERSAPGLSTAACSGAPLLDDARRAG